MRARSWCHNYLLLISLCFLLQMTLTITEISKENHASRVVKIVNHASPCQAKSFLTRLIWARSHITRHGKPLCHPKNVCVEGYVVWPFKRSPIRYSNRRVSLIVAWDQSLFLPFPPLRSRARSRMLRSSTSSRILNQLLPFLGNKLNVHIARTPASSSIECGLCLRRDNNMLFPISIFVLLFFCARYTLINIFET